MSSVVLLLSRWIVVSRPLLYPLIPILFLLGYQAGGGVLHDFSLLDVLFVLALTWPVSMILYGINDIYDYDTDSQNSARSRLDGATILPAEAHTVWWGVALATVVLITVGSLAHGWFGVLFGVLVIIASIFYSVPPLRIKSRPGLDVIFSGIMYVYVMYSAGYLLVRPGEWPPVEALILTLATVAFHALGTLRDYTADAATNNCTFAVAYGERQTSIFIVAVISLGLYFWYEHRGVDVGAMLLFVAILLPALFTIQKPNELLIKRSMWLIAVVALCVGMYKLIV